MENTDNNQSQSVAIQFSASSKLGLKQLKLMDKPKFSQAYVPFLYRNKKQRLHSSLSPAPGQYETKSDFEIKNQRDFLLQKYHIMMENTKKIKESVIFKSTAKRFNYKEQIDQIPISYSYRQSQIARFPSKYEQTTKKAKMMHKSMLNFSEKPLYPSIPDRSSKYGYTLGELGKLKKIVKTQNQLEKERETMKQYAKKLTLEKKPQHFQSSCVEALKQKSKVIQKVKQKIRGAQKNHTVLSSVHNNLKNLKKPIQISISKCNYERVSQIIQDKKKVVDSLGPGCYDMGNTSLAQNFKPQRFQFFSSSSQRFPKFIKEELDEVKDVTNYLKKKQIEEKILQARKTKSSNFRKCLRKPERISDKSQREIIQHPGPGDYNPNQKLIKSNIGKVSTFDKSLRFNQLINRENNRQKENQYKMISLKMSRENSKKNIRYKDHENSAHGLKYTEIMQRNKEYLKNKREKMEESIKKYKTNGQSEYSICSWESRPFSRNEGAQSALLQSSFRYEV